MTTFYRFRSAEHLLGDKFEELNRQTIFFADPDDLNDPMEGVRDIIWTGDRIVWVNLFKDYVNCLHWNFHHLLVLGETSRFQPEHVRNVPSWKEIPTPEAAALSQTIWSRVRETAQLNQLASKIASSNRQARRSELIGYIRVVHLYALEAIGNAYVENGFIDVADWPRIHTTRDVSTLLLNTFDLADQIDDDRFFDVALSMSDHFMTQNALIYRYNHRTESADAAFHNKMYLFHYFPSYYVDQLSRLLWPNWYAACFATHFHNSSMWAHYAYKHTGACLIFRANKIDEKNTLNLNRVVGPSADRNSTTRDIGSVVPTPFYTIHYGDKPEEVEFFRSIGTLSRKDLLDLWYTDDSGNVAECAGHLNSSNNETVWRQRHWEAFYRDITFKTTDWEYEQEYRLVLNGGTSGSLDAAARTATYDFASLKGIIFGLRMSDEDKQKIIEIVECKCRETNRTDFEFYQAYYDPEPGEIRSRTLHIQFVGLG